MAAIEYKSPGWDTHSQVGVRRIDFPLFDKGETTHMTIARTYQGPKDTLKVAPLNTLDDGFNGATYSATGAVDDILTLLLDLAFFTGCPVVISNVTGLTGLTAGTYYAIRLTGRTIKLAVSQLNARAGTPVDITATGTCDVTLPTAYLVGQSEQRAADGGVVEYDRLFATVPGPWSEPEEFAFEFPGYLASAIGAANTISAITDGGTNYVISCTTTGISAGDSVYISVKYTRDSRVYNTTFFTKATAVSAGVSVTVGRVFGGTGTFSSITGTIRAGAPGRLTAKSLVIGSRILHEYALSSAANVNTDLPILDRFTPVDSTGNEVDVLSSGAATFPNSVDYAALIVNGGELVAESSQRRYLGNIYLRATRYVPAR
jgi:hypothetical protein